MKGKKYLEELLSNEFVIEEYRNEINEYVERLEQQVKKQKEVIDKAIELNQIINNSDYVYSQDEITTKNLGILKEVSEWIR